MRFRDLPTGLEQEEWQQPDTRPGVGLGAILIFCRREAQVYQEPSNHYLYEAGAFRVVKRSASHLLAGV